MMGQIEAEISRNLNELIRELCRREKSSERSSRKFIGSTAKTKKPSDCKSDGHFSQLSLNSGFFSSQSSPIHCLGGDGGSCLGHQDLARSRVDELASRSFFFVFLHIFCTRNARLKLVESRLVCSNHRH